jgi:hypothetical protein
MRTVTLPLPAFGFVLATRAALAAGLGLIFADRVLPERRRALGFALVLFGAVTTVPAARWISRGFNRRPSAKGIGRDSRLVGATRLPRKGDDAF